MPFVMDSRRWCILNFIQSTKLAHHHLERRLPPIFDIVPKLGIIPNTS